MANPKKWNISSLNSVVLWCLCVVTMLICGYGLFRQHKLETRVIALEEQQELLKAALKEKHRGSEVDSSGVLRRETRDANDCLCPAAIRRNGSIRSIENVLSVGGQAYKSAFIQFTAVAGPCEGKVVDLNRILKMAL
ncbi:hypothetical protein O0L34_g19015 [Tuta absoluta]|nr:hypothetical protein O0L34_g19015 [Tuta absoluta]